jgi:hypothetical protein
MFSLDQVFVIHHASHALAFFTAGAAALRPNVGEVSCRIRGQELFTGTFRASEGPGLWIILAKRSTLHREFKFQLGNIISQLSG